MLTSPTSSGEQQVVQFKHRAQGETLYAFQNSTAFVQILIGPIGSAKTTDACAKVLRMINNQPPMDDGKGGRVRRSRWLVMRNTTVDLKATTIKDWKEVVPPELGKMKMDAPITHSLKWRHQDKVSYIEAEVLFVGFDALGDVRKLRGYQLTGLWADEAKELPKEVIDMAIGRLGRFPKASALDYPSVALLTSNAPAGDEWLAKIAEEPPSGYDVFIQPGGVVKVAGHWKMNPKGENVGNLKDDYYERQIAGKSEPWIRQNLANEFVVAIDGRPVHPDFSQEVHVSKHPLEPMGGVPVVIGCDWGRTPAAVFVQFLPTGQVRIYSEIATENTGIPQFGEAVKKEFQSKYEGLPLGDNYGDPSGGGPGWTDDTAFTLMAGVGIEVLPSPCGNDPAIRFASMDKLLTTMVGGEPAILIDPSCKTLIRGLAGAYHYRRMNVTGYEGRYTDKPEKTPESHTVEAAHYILVGGGVAQELKQPAGWKTEVDRLEEEFGGFHPAHRHFE